MDSKDNGSNKGNYDRFTQAIAKETGVAPDIVKNVFQAAPAALLELQEDEWVKTPLGVFRMTRRKPRRVVLPGTDEDARVEEKLVVKLKPGKRLQRAVGA